MRPRFTLTASSSIFRRPAHYADLLFGTGAEGVDLDATTWAGRVSLHPDRIERSSCPVASIWITPAEAAAFAIGRGIKPRLEASSMSRSMSGVRLVVRLPDGSGSSQDQATVIEAGRALEGCAWLSGITVVVPALAPEGGRLHLTRLRALRRLAEEWDMNLGIDLTPSTDNRWEAEAAVQIAGDRLSLLRLRAPVFNSETDVLVRTVRACADDGFTGLISLAPITPFWLGWHQPSVERDLLSNRDAVLRIFVESRSPLHSSHPTSLR